MPAGSSKLKLPSAVVFVLATAFPARLAAWNAKTSPCTARVVPGAGPPETCTLPVTVPWFADEVDGEPDELEHDARSDTEATAPIAIHNIVRMFVSMPGEVRQDRV